MIKKNDVIEMQITELLFPNKGVGFYEDQKIMIKDVLPGQKVSARISKKRSSGIEAKVCEVVEKAPYEINPLCSHFGTCGGCSYQNITYEKEAEIKKNQVLDLLEKNDIKNFDFEGIVNAPSVSGYRNKCEFSFGDEEKGGELALGMRKKASYYEVVTLKDCNIVDEDYLKIIDISLDFFKKRNVPFYHKLRHDGVLRHLVVRKAKYSGEILINLVTSNVTGFEMKEYANEILNGKYDGDIVSILHTINNSVADVVKSDETKIIYGKDYITDKVLGLEFKITAFSFFQTNTEGAEVLYSIVRDYIGETKDKVVFDLYCGTGTIGQIVAKNAKKVIGIEIIEEAVEAARLNAELNGIKNCEFIAGDVLQKIDEINIKPDIIILDPPRDGIHPKAIKKIIDFNIDKIIYVSCKPSSLARDLKIFKESGYNVEKLKCVNQFPRTNHCEVSCVLSKENKYD